MPVMNPSHWVCSVWEQLGVIGPENGISALHNELGKLLEDSQRLSRINPKDMNLKYDTVTFIVFAFCGVVMILFWTFKF